MCIDEILARCDLHLVYIRPGIFGELKLKKKFGDTIPIISPPEFPAWSTDGNPNNTDESMGENSSSNLLSTFLNVDPKTGLSNLMMDCDNNANINVGNTDTHLSVATDINGRNTTPAQTLLLGENVTSTELPWNDINTKNQDGENRGPGIARPVHHGNQMCNTLPNPIKLKENCIHTIAKSVKNDKPPNLMELCVDVMSWIPNIYYRCSLKLPQTASMRRIEFKLKRMKPYPHVFGYPHKLTPLYDNVCVDTTYKDYIMQDLKTRKYTVVVRRISKATVAKWQPPQKEAWELIDPYSSLEDVGDTTSDEIDNEVKEQSPNKDTNDPSDTNDTQYDVTTEGSYNLRERTSRRHNPHPKRSHSLDMNYNVNTHFKDIPLSPVRPTKKYKATPYGPSQDRMRVQGKCTEAPIVSHPIKHKKTLNVETSMSDNEKSDQENDVTEQIATDEPRNSDTASYSNEDNILLSKLAGSQPATVDSQNDSTTHRTKKRTLVTRKVGLRKFKQKRCFTCKVCKKSYPSLDELNGHHRANHGKVRCAKCGQLFNTPSTLAHHMYTHLEARKPCRCGKSFRFLSELNTHKLTHHRIKHQVCSHPGCGRSYFSKADLTKHARTHDNIKWRCLKCKYTTDDKRLLKSHQRVHLRKVKYYCVVCGKGFIFHTQWKRHKNQNNCTPLGRSNSPEH